jgi:predicted TIM-barrel fold metal-dependent hydrolase
MTYPIIIDMHMHLHRKREYGIFERENFEVWEYGVKDDICYSDYAGELSEALDALAKAGARKGVIVNLFWTSNIRNTAISELPTALSRGERERAIESIDASMANRLRESNEWYCSVAEENPALEAFIAADPNTLSVQDARDHIRQMVEQRGAKGIKVHPVIQGFPLHDPRMVPICRMCVEFGIPILSHCGPSQSGEQYAEPRAFAEIMRYVPDLCLILAHLGGAAWQQTAEFARAFPSVIFDCSEIIQWSGAPNAPTELELARLILEVGPERVTMGSDFPWYAIDHTVDRVFELPLLATDQKEAILGENARRILDI